MRVRKEIVLDHAPQLIRGLGENDRRPIEELERMPAARVQHAESVHEFSRFGGIVQPGIAPHRKLRSHRAKQKWVQSIAGDLLELPAYYRLHLRRVIRAKPLDFEIKVRLAAVAFEM